jgi:hypothetical protein
VCLSSINAIRDEKRVVTAFMPADRVYRDATGTLRR